MRFARVRIRMGWLVVFGCICLLPTCSNALGSDLSKETSLPLVPVDADFYTSSLRMREQWDRVLRSKTMEELKKLEIVQEALKAWKREWEAKDGEMAQARAALRTPLAQDLLKTAMEMVSEEAFVFGDGRCSKLILKLTEFNREISAVAIGDGPEGLMAWFNSLSKEDLDQLQVPTVVMGFKVKDQDRALTILDQIQAIVSLGLNAIPSFVNVAEGIERVEDSRGTRLVLTLKSEMIPWKSLGDLSPEAPELMAHFESLLKGRTIALTFGLLDDYVLFGLSEDGKQIARLGKWGANGSLLSNPHLQPLVANSENKITSIQYLSDSLSDAQFQSQWKGYFTNLYNQLQPLLALSYDPDVNEPDVPDYLRSLENDLQWLDDEMSLLVPEFKGMLGYSFATAEGQQGYLHYRTQSQFLDGKQRLEVMKHVGESPLAVIALRQHIQPKWVSLSRKVVRKVRGYLDRYLASDSLEENDREEFEMVLKKGWPILKRFADTVESSLLPSTKDGQVSFVLSSEARDGKGKNTALPTVNLLIGINDKEAFIQGCSEIYGAMDDLLELLRELNPEIADESYTIPRPEHRKEAGTDIFGYNLPDEWSKQEEISTLLDAIKPQVLVDDRWVILSSNGDQSKSLLAEKKAKIAKGKNWTNRWLLRCMSIWEPWRDIFPRQLSKGWKQIRWI